MTLDGFFPEGLAELNARHAHRYVIPEAVFHLKYPLGLGELMRRFDYSMRSMGISYIRFRKVETPSGM